MAASVSLLKTSWEKFRVLLDTRWQTYAWYVGLGLIVNGLALGIMAWALFPVVQSILSHLPEITQNTFDIGRLIGQGFSLVGLILVVMILLNLVLNFGFYRVVVDAKSPQTPKAIFQKGKENFFWTLLNLLAMAFLLVLVMGATALGGAIVAGIFGAILGDGHGRFLVTFLEFFVGFLAVVVPVTYVIVGLIFADYLVILKGCGPVEALKASWSMVHGRWWSVFGALLFWVVLYFMASILLGLIFNVFFYSMMHFEVFDRLSDSFTAQPDPEKLMLLISQIIHEIFNLKTIVLFSIDALVQSAVAIIPYFGVIALYLSLQKAPAKKR